jgi:ABC-type branched-subunit amino acid transport system ATPase component
LGDPADRVERLHATGIEVGFEGLRALDGVNLILERGEVLGLIGPNGAGKTTLVNVLSGFLVPAAGRVRLGEREVTGLSPERLGRAGIVRTFQGARLFGGLSVLDNVEIGALGRGLGRRRARAEALELIEWIGLLDFRDMPAGALPFGLERRVGIARALAMAPRFLLLDEPAAGLGEGEAEEFVRMVGDIHARMDCGILLIEHNMPLVMGLCDRVQVLAGGRTLALGGPAAIQADPAVRSAYLGVKQ